MGTAETFDSGNGFKNNEDWVTCKKCGLEYPKSWSRCSVCRTGATVTKRHSGLIAGAVVTAVILVGAYGLSQARENSAAIPVPLLQPKESFSEPTVSSPQTGLLQSHVENECVANFKVTSDDESEPCVIKLVDISNESNVVTLFVNPGETASIKVPLGSYELLCAAGSKWYGPRYLFGPYTQYTKADEDYIFKEGPSGRIDGWSVDMTPKADGNMQMDEVSKGQW